MNKILSLVMGSFGALGKSFVSKALVQYFRKKYLGNRILVIEPEKSNLDIQKMYKTTPEVKCMQLDLGEKDNGWLTLINTLNKTDAQNIIVHTQADSYIGIQKYGKYLDEGIRALASVNPIDFKIFWIQNRTLEFESLKILLDSIESAVIYPTLNLHFIHSDQFIFSHDKKELYNLITARGGCELFFPFASDCIINKIATAENNFEETRKSLTLGLNICFYKWFQFTEERCFDKVFKI